jgi:DNA polymerase-1
MLLQVHDELIFEIVKGEESKLKEIVIEAMSEATELKVPLDVQLGVGPSWKAAGH